MVRFALAIAFLTTAFVAPDLRAQPVKRTDLKPGLAFAVWDDGKKTNDPVAARIEPGVALNLEAGEAAHPQSTGGEAFVWKGYINILSPGKYTFAAGLNGTVDATIAETVVLAESAGAAGKTRLGKEVQLAAGIQPFSVTLKRTAGEKAVRLELLWQGPQFRLEPIPYFFYGHLPTQRPVSLTVDQQKEHGRFLFEELSCVRCHKPTSTDAMAKTLVERTGPNLTDIGRRAYPGWIDAWLADPHKLRPQTVMPKLFADTEAGIAERYAVTAYLSSLGGPVAEFKPAIGQAPYQKSIADGQKLYLTAGCAACHGEKLTQPPTKKAKDDEDDKPDRKPEDSFYAAGTAGPQSFYLLGGVGSKFTPDALQKFLLNPLATNPHGRMPNMVLANDEARDLARFLCRTTDESYRPQMPKEPTTKPDVLAEPLFPKAADYEAFTELKTADQWKELGKKLLTNKGCVNCHTIEPAGKALAAAATAPMLEDIEKLKSPGCLAAMPDVEKTPVYSLEEPQRDALKAFLKDGLSGPGSKAPIYQAKLAIRRFNCLNCHNRDGEGGFAEGLANAMKLHEKAENADDVSPPRLTGVGHKMRSSWLKQVLTQAGRARPWMTLRMPQYGDANVGFLTEALPKLEGTMPDDTQGKVAITAAKVEAGRTLAGKTANGHGCISCHDISGVLGGGTRGPDLATTHQRVRYEWYGRWMHQPQRLAPGTKMPQVYIDGKAQLSTVLGGDADQQIEAMWSYFTLGPGLPLPAGIEPPKGLIIAVKDRAEVLRTFMPDGAGSKAVAVGYPGGVNLVFDAAQCRLSYAWGGNFLNASPVWDGRGGNPAKLLGTKFFDAPKGFPWAVTESRSPPDFAKRADDPSYGKPLQNDEFFGGPHLVKFGGYGLDATGQPTFRYALVDDDGKPRLGIAEKPEPLPTTVAAGLKRNFALDQVAGKTTWFLAAIGTKDPRAISATGTVWTPDPKSDDSEVTALGYRVVVPTADRTTVLELAAGPATAAWRFVPQNGQWLVMLRLPEPAKDGKVALSILTWGLPRDDAELLKGLKGK